MKIFVLTFFIFHKNSIFEQSFVYNNQFFLFKIIKQLFSMKVFVFIDKFISSRLKYFFARWLNFLNLMSPYK